MAEWHREEIAVARLRSFEDHEQATAVALGRAGPPIGHVEQWSSIALGRIAPGDWLAVDDAAALVSIVDRWNDATVRGLRMGVDVSSAYAAFAATGGSARERLSAFCPLDLRDDRFGERRIARSLLGGMPAIFIRGADASNEPCFRLLVDRTMLDYVEHLLAG